jgi:hypothetical protein
MVAEAWLTVVPGDPVGPPPRHWYQREFPVCYAVGSHPL